MFDSSAYDLLEPDAADSGGASTSTPAAESTWSMPASLTLAACAVCQRAMGECAVTSAQAGAMSPALALAVCNSAQRLIERAMEARERHAFAYLAYVLLGAAQSEAIRRADTERLGEIIR